MNPTLMAISVYLGLLVAVAAAEKIHDLGHREIKTRTHLAWLALTGHDFRRTQMDPGMITHTQAQHPADASDPILAHLLRAGEAERRWYALHALLDQWERDLKHRDKWLPEEERYLDQFLYDQFRQATEEARGSIRSRIELHHWEEPDLSDRYMIEDPATEYRQKIRVSHRELMELDPGTHAMPPAVEQRVETFPNSVLRELEGRSDRLKQRI